MPIDPAAETMISVVVPVFNVGDYITEGLDSLKHQDFDMNYEVILIEDCSTDNSLELCRRFITQYPQRFILLESERNAGVSVARNRGLERARGRYFMFVDADDVLPPSALSTLFQGAEESQVDIVKGNNTIFGKTRELPANYNVSKSVIVKGKAVLTTLLDHEKLRGHPWGKLFRREKLGQFRFPVGVRMAQDLFYCSEVFASAESLLLLDQTIYRYRKHEGGSTGRKFISGSYIDWLESVENTAKFADNPEQMRAHVNLLVRTMNQLARECRQLAPEKAQPVLSVIEDRCNKYQLGFFRLFLKHKLGPRSLARYVKMRLAIRQIRHMIKNS